MPASYTLKKKFTPYLFFMMFVLVFVVAMLFYSAYLGSLRLVLLTFLLLAIFAAIIMTIAWYNKMEDPKPKVIDEHALK